MNLIHVNIKSCTIAECRSGSTFKLFADSLQLRLSINDTYCWLLSCIIKQFFSANTGNPFFLIGSFESRKLRKTPKLFMLMLYLFYILFYLWLGDDGKALKVNCFFINYKIFVNIVKEL